MLAAEEVGEVVAIANPELHTVQSLDGGEDFSDVYNTVSSLEKSILIIDIENYEDKLYAVTLENVVTKIFDPAITGIDDKKLRIGQNLKLPEFDVVI